jgi:peptidoglycan hydrolase CwlO-like protein
MELVMIILAIGIIFWINNPSIDKEKLMIVFKALNKDLTREFKKSDDKIKELEKKIKRLEDTIVEKGLFNEQ